MSVVIRAFPIRSPETLEALIATLNGDKRAEADSFFRSYRVTHESWHTQQTPMGQWAIGLTILDDAAEAAPRYADAKDGFDAWFKSQIGKVTGVDLNEQPLGPPTEEVFRWSDAARPNLALA